MFTTRSQTRALASESDHEHTGPPRIAYIVSRFPKLTETFVLYEAVQMEKLGVLVDIFPLMRERECVVHDEAGGFVERARFHSYFSLAMLRAQLHFIKHSPQAYGKAFSEVLRGTFGSLKFFVGALCFFPKAVCFAYDAVGRGVTHVHAQFATHPALVALVIHRLTSIPFSFTARGSDIHVDRRMLKEKIQASAFVITVSSFNKKLMMGECGDDLSEKIHVVYGGVDIHRLSPRPKMDAIGTFQILCIARFEEVKGHTYLVQACRLLKQRGLSFECHLVGQGELRTNIEKQIAEEGLAREIKLHGACTYGQIVERLSQTDVVVLATAPTESGKCEGIPNALKEAMACGLPVVASSVSGIPELVDDGNSGILVPARNPNALAEALQRLSQDPALRARMGFMAREKIVRDFNLRTSTRRRAELFLSRIENQRVSEPERELGELLPQRRIS